MMHGVHFDMAWKMIIQITLTSLFLLTFWILLWIGAGLFKMINLSFLSTFIQKHWFAIPATTIVFNLGLHITDIKISLVRSVRTILLTLLSWLLPLLTLLVTAFLITLLFTGLAPLWQLGYTDDLLFFIAGLLIVLINAAYQDGSAMPRILSYTNSTARVILLPVVALSAYALALSVNQSGWTINSILLAAGQLITAFYALGYAFFCWRLKGLERWNFYAAILIVIVLTVLLTPVADPMRLSVMSQIARLKSGRIGAETFNFEFLRWDSGRFGYQALNDLKVHSEDPWIRKQASILLTQKLRYSKPEPQSVIVADTPSGNLPQSFLQQDWKGGSYYYNFPACITNNTRACTAWAKSIQGKNGIIILENTTISVFQEIKSNVWQYSGHYKLPDHCNKILDRVHAGLFKLSPPVTAFPDLDVMGQRFYFYAPEIDACPDEQK